ncbi:MAG: hypothetical protein VR68_13730 [Peptococcaceae bacterium BRH_c4a]|nr:MAG: hypothetical protein VR68_13730 [Peptococcaceae bacterium BRH_c4a]
MKQETYDFAWSRKPFPERSKGRGGSPINLPGVKQAYSETVSGTKVDVYQEKKLVKGVVFAI